MTLFDAIKEAQRKAKATTPAWNSGARDGRKVFKEMSPAAQTAWLQTNMPDYLLSFDDLSTITRFAAAAMIYVPTELPEEKQPAAAAAQAD